MAPRPRDDAALRARSTDEAPVVTARLAGGGQRLHFTFGGVIEYAEAADVVSGHFSIIVHPLAPAGTALNVACRYDELSGWVRSGALIEVDAPGVCVVLRTDGTQETLPTTNHLSFLEGGAGVDAFDAELTSATGIAVPGGFLDFGDFTVVDVP